MFADARRIRWWWQLATRRAAVVLLTMLGVGAVGTVAVKFQPTALSGADELESLFDKPIPDSVYRSHDPMPETNVRPPPARKVAPPPAARLTSAATPTRPVTPPVRSTQTTSPGRIAATKSALAPTAPPPDTKVAPTPPASPASSPPVGARAVTRTVAALDSGVVAYRRGAYFDAVRQLRVSVAGLGTDTLGPATRSMALMYLGASELSLGRPDSATTAFRMLLAHSPQYRADALRFAKPVTDFFEGIRKSLHGLARVRATERGFRVTVYAINPHRVSVEVHADSGRRLVGLYEGPSADSLSVDWDERGPDGRTVSAGRYEFVVTARALDGRLLSVARFPIVIDRAPTTGESGR